MAELKDDVAIEAVRVVADYLQSRNLTPFRFSPQIALCALLELADEEPGSVVSQWILSAPRERLWIRDSTGCFVEGDEMAHIRFRAAWEDFLLSEHPLM